MPQMTNPTLGADDSTIEITGGVIAVKGKTLYSGTGWNITGLQDKKRYKIYLRGTSSTTSTMTMSINSTGVTNIKYTGAWGSSVSTGEYDYFYLCTPSVASIPIAIKVDIIIHGTTAYIYAVSQNNSNRLMQYVATETLGAALSTIKFACASATDLSYLVEEWEL